jgi:DNA-binding winged helix-turn-helix (wHTH) protein
MAQTNVPEFPVLIGQTGPINGQKWNLKDTLLIGRDSECDVVIPDRQVSRYHARVTITKDGVQVEDLGSKNGTFLNGRVVQEPAFLLDGDLVQIALVQKIVFLNSDATLPMDFGSSGNNIRKGRLFIDPKSRRVWILDQEVIPHLSAPQFRLLDTLYQQQGRVIPRQEIIHIVWADEEAEGITDQALDALIRRLRDRIATIDPDHNYIATIRGHGLRLDNPN